jgi:hypothetical protein
MFIGSKIMAEKNMKSIMSALAPVASSLPSQDVSSSRPAKPSAPVTDEPQVQFAFSLRKSLRKQLARLADDADMTMRAFILNALKKRGWM